MFRFLFVYLLLYNLQAFLGVASILPGTVEGQIRTRCNMPMPEAGPWSGRPEAWLEQSMHTAIPKVWSWVPDQFKFGSAAKEITVFPNGSGDTTYNYAEVAMYAMVALLATAAWTLLSRYRRDHRRLHGFLRVYLRYVLAFALIGYGMAKVIPLQMPAPDPFRLTEAYGDSSPMGILWAFIGASKAYSVFAGAGEVLAGLLLLWRRTTTLGALVAVAVMAHVVALNFCYDVPVKLYSSYLLLAAIVLVAPQVSRLATVLLTDRALPPGRTAPLFSRRWLHYAWGGIKGLLIIAYLTTQTLEGVNAYYSDGDGAAPPPLYGLYTVEEHTLNGEARPPLVGDPDRWREVIIGRVYSWGDGKGVFRARNMKDEPSWYRYSIDTQTKTLSLTGTQRGPTRLPMPTQPATTQPASNQPTTYVLKYREPDAEHLVLEGRLGDDEVVLKLVRKPLDHFLLVNRGFHWINEYPMNR